MVKSLWKLKLFRLVFQVRRAPRRRAAPRPSQCKPHSVRPVEDITEDELQLVADSMTDKVYNRATVSSQPLTFSLLAPTNENNTTLKVILFSLPKYQSFGHHQVAACPLLRPTTTTSVCPNVVHESWMKITDDCMISQRMNLNVI